MSEEKFVIVFMGNIVVFGGYWIFMNVDWIVVEVNIIIGFIGVFGVLFNI